MVISDPPGPGEYLDLPRLEVVRAIPLSAKSVLDVGCYRGGFGAALKASRDVFVWGIEPNPEAAQAAAERLDKVTVGTFPDAAPDEQFDCVTFLDSLEHMIDPWGALRSSRQLLTPGGSVVASIPNVRHHSVILDLLKGKWEYTDSGFLDRTHLRFFTKRSMIELFERAGLDVVSVTPTTTEPGGSRLGRTLRVLGRSTEEFRAMQYLVHGQ